MADTDRAFVSQYSTEDVGFSIIVSSVPTDADADVTVVMTNTDTGSILFTRTADHVSTGTYQITLTPDDTAVLGNYQAVWSYTLSGNVQLFTSYFAIGGAEPAYDQLGSALQTVVDDVWIRMADMWDSPSGGPNLTTWAQTNFTRGRVAQLLKIALGRLNTQAQPTSTYSIMPDGTTDFPMAQWGALLEQITWVEVIKHLRRSYLEQPQYEGATVSRLDRQAYFDRWTQVLAEEQADLKLQIDNFKISQMFLGSTPSVLVYGGAFGRYSSMNRPFMAARGRIYFANVFS